MIRILSGVLIISSPPKVVLDVGGVGYAVTLHKGAFAELPALGAPLRLHAHLQVREDALELYGFLREEELGLFDRLMTVSGVGPKSAMAILGVAPAQQLVAAINEGRVDLLTRVPGIGKKTADRVILELRGKLAFAGAAAQTLDLMSADMELEDTLVSLGYSKAQAKTAVARIPKEVVDFKARLKEALKNSR
jgi:Holliday junction DNA helicase RuvA